MKKLKTQGSSASSCSLSPLIAVVAPDVKPERRFSPWVRVQKHTEEGGIQKPSPEKQREGTYPAASLGASGR